jgi:hypothetical protein
MSPTSWHKSQRKFRSPHQCGKVNDGADEVLTIKEAGMLLSVEPRNHAHA